MTDRILFVGRFKEVVDNWIEISGPASLEFMIFDYKVLRSGRVLNNSDIATSFLSIGGICVTDIDCKHKSNRIGFFALTVETGVNKLAIDSTLNNRSEAPSLLPLLGAAAAFGCIRKLRRFSSHLKTYSMGQSQHVCRSPCCKRGLFCVSICLTHSSFLPPFQRGSGPPGDPARRSRAGPADPHRKGRHPGRWGR